ncbi:hypothetical protein JCM8097_000805 [Rhodosporidiobolus ruineniae]
MSSSSSPTSLPPPRNLGDLPTELKAHIVELCAEQDEAFREWVKRRSTVAVELKKTTSWSGRSIAALFQVSKEFSALAAPHHFEVLRASKIDLRFECAVAPRRIHVFDELHLDARRAPISFDLLPYLPQLRDVRKLVVGKYALQTLWCSTVVTFETLPHQTAEAQYAIAGFRWLRSLEEIEVPSVKAHYINLSSLLPFAQLNKDTLRSLILTFSDASYPTALAGLAGLLNAALNLSLLKISCTAQVYGGAPFDLSAVKNELTAAPPLTELYLCPVFLNTSLFAFASSFSATLEQLTLHGRATTAPLTYVQPRFTVEHFPRVTTLSIRGYANLVCTTLASVTSSIFPSLTTLNVNLDQCTTWRRTDGGGPLSSFQTFPSLKTLSIDKSTKYSSTKLATVREICAQAGWDLAGAPSSSPSSSSSSPSSTPPLPLRSQTNRQADKIRATLAYAEQAVTKAEGGADSAGLERIRAVLQPLEAEKETRELQMRADRAWERA